MSRLVVPLIGKSHRDAAESLPLWLESDRGLGIELRGRIVGTLQPKGQCDGEAFGMGGSDQLFGIGPFSFSKRVPIRARIRPIPRYRSIPLFNRVTFDRQEAPHESA